MRTRKNVKPAAPLNAKKALREMRKKSHLGDYGHFNWKADLSAPVSYEVWSNKHVQKMACLYSLLNLAFCGKEIVRSKRFLKCLLKKAHPYEIDRFTQEVGSWMDRDLWLEAIDKSPDGDAFKHARGEISWDLEIAAIAVSKHCDGWGWENTGENSLCWNMSWYTRKQFRYGKPSAMAYLAWLDNERQGRDENLPWYTDEDGLIWGTLDEENEFKW